MLQSLLTLLAPTLFAAAIYMILGRLIRLLGADSYSMIRTKWLTKVFLLGDMLSFFCQCGGMCSPFRSRIVKCGEHELGALIRMNLHRWWYPRNRGFGIKHEPW